MILPIMGITVLLLIVSIPQVSAISVGGQDQATEGSTTVVTSTVLVLPPGCPDIDYVFTGTGTGNLGTSNFADADFTVRVWGNTCNVMEILRPGTFTNRALMASVEVVGVGTAMVTEETGVFSNTDPLSDTVGWSEFTGDNLNVDINNLVNVGVAAANYQLTTNFGPVFDPTPFGFQVTVSTDAGIFDVQNIRDGSFTARIKEAIGGDISPMSTSALLLAGSQNMMAWMIPVIVSGIGFGIVIARKF